MAWKISKEIFGFFHGKVTETESGGEGQKKDYCGLQISPALIILMYFTEREPVFSHLALSHKPDSNPFGQNDITLDSAALQSAKWIMKESQNRVSCGSKDNEEDAGQVPYVKNDEDEVKDFVPPYTLSSEKLEALEKESDYYMDKSVMECELPELIVCYKESSCNTIKDICIDEGVPSQDKNRFETGVDEKECCTFLSPDEDQNKQLLEEQMDIVVTLPDGFKSSAHDDLEKGFVIPCDSKDLMQIGDAIYYTQEKSEIEVSKEIFFPANVLPMQELGAGNAHSSKSSNEDSTEAVQDTVQSSVTEESSHSEKKALVSAAEESNFHVDELSNNSKVENGSTTSGLLDTSVHVSTTRDACPENDVHKHFETQTMPAGDDGDDNDDNMPDAEIVPSQVQPCSAPVVTGREECPENGVCQPLDTSSTSKVDDEIPHSVIVSSQVQHYSAPVTISREERPENGVWQCPETSNAFMVGDVNSDTQYASFHVQRGFGESSFSAAGPYSGNVSLRSESSTTSTRSFAFP
ncbi:18S pre-ribosomal assembly protein gar2-related protein, partial [Prunus dulcis]